MKPWKRYYTSACLWLEEAPKPKFSMVALLKLNETMLTIFLGRRVCAELSQHVAKVWVENIQGFSQVITEGTFDKFESVPMLLRVVAILRCNWLFLLLKNGGFGFLGMGWILSSIYMLLVLGMTNNGQKMITMWKPTSNMLFVDVSGTKEG